MTELPNGFIYFFSLFVAAKQQWHNYAYSTRLMKLRLAIDERKTEIAFWIASTHAFNNCAEGKSNWSPDGRSVRSAINATAFFLSFKSVVY